jgi:hypothetical protein
VLERRKLESGRDVKASQSLDVFVSNRPVEGLPVEISDALHAPGHGIERHRVNAARSRRRQHTEIVRSEKEARPRAPVHRLAVVSGEVVPLLIGDRLCPASAAPATSSGLGHQYVHRDEPGPPRAELDAIQIHQELFSLGEVLPDVGGLRSLRLLDWGLRWY